MVKSNLYQETINLGKKIVSEFSNEEIRDTTLQWMAHYLAELIQSAEQEKSLPKKRKLQEECAEIIENIWKKRATFRGNTRPLAKFGEVVSILKALIDDKKNELSWNRFIDYENDSPWGEYIRKVRLSMDDILTISLCAAAIQQALEKEKEWLDHAPMLSSHEKKIIEHLDYLLNKQDSIIKIVFTDEESKPKSELHKDKRIQVFEKLANLGKLQAEYLNNLKEKLKDK
jgi:hypothetical protein